MSSTEQPPPMGEIPPESLKFEDAIARLEDIVRRMEEDQMPLEDLIRDYEAGTLLLRVCRERIDVARARIEQIGHASGASGVVLEDFDPEKDEASSTGGKNVRLL